MKHTPGPWIFSGYPSYWIETKENIPIAYLVCPVSADAPATPEAIATAEANARLIAAAPELLKALQGCVRNYLILAEALLSARGEHGMWNPEKDTAIINARAAIAKATEES